MIARLRQAGLVWPTVLTIAALAVLVSLGVWQWQRMVWKQGLLAKLEANATAAPVPLGTIASINELDGIRFRRIKVVGQFDHAREFHLWAPGTNGPAWRIVTPFRLRQSLGDSRYPLSSILVIRGFTDDAHKSAASRPSGQIVGDTTVIGRVRLPSSNWATPAPDMKNNQWYGLDLDQMRRIVVAAHVAGSASGSVDEAQGLVAPFFLEAETAVAPPPAPQPDLRRLTLRNRHLEYAMTWWGLALTLIGVYTVFAIGRYRRSTGRPPMP